jgi:hypothetical protein
MLGIGLNVAVFAIVNGVMLRPLPVERPDELVRVFTSEWSAHGVSDRPFGATSYPDFTAFRGPEATLKRAETHRLQLYRQTIYWRT